MPPLPKRSLALLVLLTSPSAAPAQEVPIRIAEMAGCYDLRLGEWSPPMALGGDTVFLQPPSRIELDTTMGTVRGGRVRGYGLQPAPGARPSVHRYAYWTVSDSLGVRLVWTNGLSGVRMLLQPQGNTLRGTAETFWDFDRPKQTTGAVASPVACSDTLGVHRAPATWSSIFTDTTLFRTACMEADSGLTAKTAGRCTPRNQSPRRLPRRAAPERLP